MPFSPIPTLFWISLAILFAVSAQSSASVMSAVDVPAITQASDLVVTGQVVKLRDMQHDGKDIEVFAIVPDCIMKGAAAERISATLIISANAPWQMLRDGEFGMFFLRVAGNAYTIVDASHPILMSVPQLKVSSGSDSLSAVATALAEVFAMSPVQLASEGSALDRPLSMGKSGEHVYSEAFDEIATIPSATALASIRSAIMRSRDKTARMWGNALEVYFGDEQGLAELTVRLNARAPRSDLLTTFVRDAIRHHEYWSDAAIPSFSKLLGSDDVRLRQAAAYALRNNHSKASVAVLRDTALRDTNEEVRTYAVRGLCETTQTCNGIEQISYYAKPENRDKLVILVNKSLEEPR